MINVRKSLIFCLLLASFLCKAQIGTVLTIYFESNSSKISSEDKVKLESVIERCNAPSFVFLKIFGYADTSGSEAYNDKISERRCWSAFNLIYAKAKIDKSQMYMTWLGESTDVYDLHFHSPHPQERCVDIWVQSKE